MASILDYCKGLPTITLHEGDILLQEGHRSDKFYILIDGECEVLKDNFQINKVSEPGSIFGEMSILLNIRPMTTVKSIRTTRVYVVDNALKF